MTTPAKVPRSLTTAHGPIIWPAYVPVTTFGGRYPLDDLIRPYLPRLSQAVMVSYHYAKQMKERPTIPLFIDSGGFASLFKNAKVRKVGRLGVLETNTDERTESLHPREVLDFQEEHADIACTLDFPIPPSMPMSEARRRLSLTVANACWALENRRRKNLLLFACVQGWDVASYSECAKAYAEHSFDGIAVGGLVPRVHDIDNVVRIIDAVRAAVPNKPIHVFGLGKPAIVEVLFRRGVQSVDSTSYVKLAADGKLWGQPDLHLSDASQTDRLHLALCNLAMATQRTLPLSSCTLLFGSPLWEPSRSFDQSNMGVVGSAQSV